MISMWYYKDCKSATPTYEFLVFNEIVDESNIATMTHTIIWKQIPCMTHALTVFNHSI